MDRQGETPPEGDPPRDVQLMDWAFAQSTFALAIHDGDMRCLRINERMCRMRRLKLDFGGNRRNVLPGADEPRVRTRPQREPERIEQN